MTTKGHTLVEVMMIDVSMDRPKVSRSAFPFNLKSISPSNGHSRVPVLLAFDSQCLWQVDSS